MKKMKMRKEYQRKLNKKVRTLNKNIKNDDLWLGRFVMYQKEANMYEFEDGSGGLLYTIMRIYDKKTGYYRDFNFEFAPYLKSCDWHLWEAMNKFITEYTNTWKGEKRPYNDVVDYTKIKMPNSIIYEKYNFYLDENAFMKERC